MTTHRLELSAGFDRSIAWAQGGSVRYLVARVEARPVTPEDRAERGPLNIALAIDASGSMAGGKLEAAKRASLALLGRLSPRDRLSVVSFASDVVTHLRAVPMDEAGRAQASHALGQLQTRGSTHLSGGWFAAVDAAAEAAERNPGLAPRVVILSDGHANEGITSPDALAHHAGELRRRGVITSTLGIGDGYDEALLAAIAENGGGRLHDAERTDEIEHVLLGEIGEAMAQVADAVHLSLSVPAGVRAEPLGLSAAEAQPGRLGLSLGGISAGVPRTAVIRLLCPAGEPGAGFDAVLSASATASRSGDRLDAPEARCRLTFGLGRENDRQARDEARSIAAARAWHAHVLRQAALLNRDADIHEAQAYLGRELAHFTRFARDLPGGPELIEQLELLRRRSDRRWGERTRKEMVLHSAIAERSGLDHRGPGRSHWTAHIANEPDAP